MAQPAAEPAPTTASPARAPAPPTAAPAAPLGRPRICLVLSGGGARGAAHVGVLKVLEELHVPIDCIAGTSMGAIVGGAYASGTSVAEMEARLQSLTTEALFTDDPPRPERSMRRKADDARLFVGPEIGVDAERGLRLPKGVVSGTALEAVLRRLVHSGGVNRFDRMPIPFRAVATDIESGQMVVFAQGDVPNVMRASMSVPGVVAPVEIGNRELVDGGLVRNLPVDVARAMGADVVIAVNLGTPLMKREDINSVLDVSGQMINILTEQNVRASLAQLTTRDVLISPELGAFSAGDFSGAALAVAIGEAAARLEAPRLAALAVAPEVYAQWAERFDAARNGSPLSHALPIAEVKVTGTERVNPEVLLRAVSTRPGQPFDQRTMDDDLRRLYGWGDFERVGFKVDEAATRPVVTYDVSEKSWGPDYLRFGLGLQSDFSTDSSFTLLASYRRTWLNSYGAEWRNDLQLGRHNLLHSEFFQPLDLDRRWFIAPHIDAGLRPLTLYNGDAKLLRYGLAERLAGIDLGLDASSSLQLRAGPVFGSRRLTLDTGAFPGVPHEVSDRVGALRLQARSDTLDNRQFPGDGHAASATVTGSRRELGADADYTRWEADWMSSASLRSHVLALRLRAGGKFGGNPLPISDQFRLGGFMNLSGYAPDRFYGGGYELATITYADRVLEIPLLRGAYAGMALELGRMRQQPLGGGSGVRKSLAPFVAVDSPLGPVYLGLGLAPDGMRSAYITLGLP
ncbi:patatin-like phospholipase family protein [Derxia lacustris]|uniref:patatin-like phospholipase family protein n=1 Tax=Derxia lacustris TaxID=764842 RepID=UPI001F27BB01|nr:patatin-like phospholipase family protein [Derxia lacustris]